MKKINMYAPFFLLGLFVVHAVLWYGVSFYFEGRLKKTIEELGKQGIEVTYSKGHTGGYPARFQHHFHDVRVSMRDQWVCTIPILSLQTTFLFPLHKHIEGNLEGVTCLTSVDEEVKGAFTNLRTHVSLSPLKLSFDAQAMTLLFEDIPFGEGQKTHVSFEERSHDQIHIHVESEMKFWFANPRAPTLPVHLMLECSVTPKRCIWAPLEASLLPLVTVTCEKLQCKMLGATLSAQGGLEKKHTHPWEGKLDLRFQGLSQLTRFLKDFTSIQKGTLMKIVARIADAFDVDEESSFGLSCEIKEGYLRLKEFPFFTIPLF